MWHGVGILGMATGMDARGARNETNVGDIELAPGKYLKSYHTFLDSKSPDGARSADQALASLKEQGAQVIVASEAFSVDNPENEMMVMPSGGGNGLEQYRRS